MRISDWSSDVCSSDLSTGGSVRIVAAYSAITTKSQNSDPAHSSMVAPFTRSMARKTTANRRKNIKLAVGRSARRAAVIIIKMLMPPQSTDENGRSEENTSELQALMRISYAAFCLNKKKI